MEKHDIYLTSADRANGFDDDLYVKLVDAKSVDEFHQLAYEAISKARLSHKKIPYYTIGAAIIDHLPVNEDSLPQETAIAKFIY